MKNQKEYNYLEKTFVQPDGKRKHIYGRTEEELQKKVADYLALTKGYEADSFGAFVIKWYETYKKPHLRKRSQESLEYILGDYILPTLGKQKIEDISPKMIRLLMLSIKDKSFSLQQKVLTQLRSIFRAAEENCLIEKSPVSSTVKPSGEKTSEKIPLTPTQVRQLLARVTEDEARTFVMLALFTGMHRKLIKKLSEGVKTGFLTH